MNSLNKQLYNACKEGNLEKVKELFVSLGADINFGSQNKKLTPIMIASSFGHLNIVKYLYYQGANPTLNNNYAIHIASGNGKLEVVKWLYSIGCDPTDKNNLSILWASSRGHLEVVKWLYSIGCDPTAQSNIAIKRASECNEIELVKFLALVGCNTSVITKKSLRKTVLEYLNEYKPIMDTCIAEIYGHPGLERTKTENEELFQEFNKK